MKKIGLFVLAYFVLTMAWAYPWHVIWFHDLYVAWGAFTRGQPVMELGMAAILVQGLVIAHLYQFYPKSGHPVLAGIKFNLIIGLMTYTAMGFATAAKFQIEPIPTFLAYHTVFQLVQFTLTGAALGWIYREAR
ncbi:MAG: hypothetical protein COW30_02220 [Rhodospirillales bacterium CG15_BIG_FIL_POST_REV_8_21_14_020_66_15]|nr:MAG: hypothetical protein COW30_02220 [Rhodospirillales bacterium CG15_BIG_FIL_POST_REV_8_21_14_020_66_15]